MHIIFFDLDDTMIATKDTNRAIFEKVRKALGIHMATDQFQAKFRSILRTHMLRLDFYKENESIGIDPIDYYFFREDYPYGDLNQFKEDVFSDFCKEFKGEFSAERLDEVMFSCGMEYDQTISGMRELVSYVRKHCKTGLITNGISQVQRKKIAATRLEVFFDWMFISGDYGYGKPDPKFYGEVLRSTGARPEDCVMIGDNLQADYFGAKAAGMDAIFFSERDVPYEVRRATNAEEVLERLRPLLFS